MQGGLGDAALRLKRPSYPTDRVHSDPCFATFNLRATICLSARRGETRVDTY